MIRLLLLFVALIAPWTPAQAQYRLAIGAIFHNDARFLKEWIEYHNLLGVEHFWLYNHQSTDNYLAVLQPYIESGLVELVQWPIKTKDHETHRQMQITAYQDIVAKSSSSTDWMAFIDTDEFLLPIKESSVIDCLETYFPNCSGVVINWYTFGTSGVKRIPSDKTLIEMLTLRAPDDSAGHTKVKAIVRPSHIRGFSHAHWPDMQEGRILVGGSNLPYHPRQPIFVDHIRINHYWTRDESFLFDEKARRYQLWARMSTKRAIAHLTVQNAKSCVVKDEMILRFLPALRQRLQLP